MRRVHPRTLLDTPDTVAVQVLCAHSNVNAGTNVFNVFGLPDTGATSNTYIDKDVAQWLLSQGVVAGRCETVVCSGVGKSCDACRGVVTMSVRIFNELNKTFEILPLEAEILETLAYPLIIGLTHIRKHKLVHKWPSFFLGADEQRTLSTAPLISTLRSIARPPTGLSSRTTPTLLCQLRSEARERYAKAEVLTPLPDYDYLSSRVDEPPPWEEAPQSVDEKIASVHIEHFKERHEALLRKYIVALSPELSTEPADIPPMVLKVDETKWRSPKNQGPPRTQSTAKQLATRGHIDKMLKASVIVPSQEPY